MSQRWSAVFCSTGVWGGKTIGRVRVKLNSGTKTISIHQCRHRLTASSWCQFVQLWNFSESNLPWNQGNSVFRCCSQIKFIFSFHSNRKKTISTRIYEYKRVLYFRNDNSWMAKLVAVFWFQFWKRLVCRNSEKAASKRQITSNGFAFKFIQIDVRKKFVLLVT